MSQLVYVDCLEPTQNLSFYLSMEEFVARHLPPADYFFMWQVMPSVIFGRNQDPALYQTE